MELWFSNNSEEKPSWMTPVPIQEGRGGENTVWRSLASGRVEEPEAAAVSSSAAGGCA